MTGTGEIIEIQGTAEKEPFHHDQLDRLLNLAGQGISQLIKMQEQSLESSEIQN